MKRTLRRCGMVLSLTLVLTLVLSLLVFAGQVEIVIMQTADMHGRIYPHDYATDSLDSDAGFAKIQTLVKKVRSENPDSLLIDCGDTVQDNSAELFNDLPVHPMVQCMNKMEYDIWVIGNHEFNFEKDFLVKNIEGFNGKVLAGNIRTVDDDSRFVDAYKIFDIAGVEVAVVGLVTPHIPRWEASSPSHFAGLRFNGIIEETEQVLEEIEGKYDVLVGAFHLGRDGEYGSAGLYDVADKFPQFNIIFGGHEHASFIEDRNGVKLIEPGRYGWALAKAKITVEDGKAVDITAENLKTYSQEPDQEILDEFAFVHKKSVEDANEVVGEITDTFIKKVDYITGEDRVTTMPTAQIIDTSVIDLINDVQMYYTGADISSAALFNFGSNLKQGDFKKKDVAFIYKYPNTLMGVKITGENLKKYMEWSASYYNTYRPGDITISFNADIRGYNYDMFSGLTYEINLSKEPGNRIENVKINGRPLEKDKVYKLAVNNYRFGTLLGLGLVKNDDKYFDSYEEMQDDGRIRSLIVKYVQEEKDGILEPEVDNNWKITGVNLDHPLKESIIQKVIDGSISIPESEDGRTLNVKSLNIGDLKKEGIVDLSTIPGVKKYTVKDGDTFKDIAAKYNTTMKEIAHFNGITDPDMITVGQVIYIQ